MTLNGGDWLAKLSDVKKHDYQFKFSNYPICPVLVYSS